MKLGQRCIGVFRREIENKTKFYNYSAILYEKIGPKLSRRFVSPLSIFSAPFGLHGRFFGQLGWQHCLNRTGGWVGGGGESRPENIRQLEVGTTAASVCMLHGSVSYLSPYL